MAVIRDRTEKALKMLRILPRVAISNLRPNPGTYARSKRRRGIHGGGKSGGGDTGQRNYHVRLGYAGGSLPFHLRFPCEKYYRDHDIRREYPHVTMMKLQVTIEQNRLDITKPIDLTSLINSGVFKLADNTFREHQYGFQLTDEGINNFKSKICIEVQHAPESVIAAIERNGGVIRTAYYDPCSIRALVNPKKFFESGNPIPTRLLPPQDLIAKYTSAKERGYLADPEEISRERVALAQKYGYELPRIEDDPDYEWMNKWKDPRQIFYGLEPGWVINLHDKCIIKSLGHRVPTKVAKQKWREQQEKLQREEEQQ